MKTDIVVESYDPDEEDSTNFDHLSMAKSHIQGVNDPRNNDFKSALAAQAENLASVKSRADIKLRVVPKDTRKKSVM